jgi:MurNAc alpha-1-phosphate uridylyltransferase
VPLPVAILAGGLATRLGPLSATTPKALIEVAGRPFAEHQIALLRRHGYTRLIYLVGHLGEQIVAALGDGSRYGVTITYIFDGPRLLGTGGALRAALPVLGDAFFVLYGDSYLEIDYSAVERAFLASSALGLMTVFRNAGRWERSNVLFRAGRVLRYDKFNPQPEMEHLDYGLNAFRAAAFAGYPVDEPLDLAIVQRDLAQRGQLLGYEVNTRFYEVGSPTGLAETRAFLSRRQASP